MDLKKCPKCNLLQELNNFVFIKKKKVHASWCRNCTNYATKNSREKNPQVYKDYAISYCKKNPLFSLRKNMRLKHMKMGIDKDLVVSIRYLKSLWEKQNGICFWSGLKMDETLGGRQNPLSVSPDRLNTKLGYVEGNIVLCCHWTNLGRSEASIEKWTEVLKKLNIIGLWSML